MSDSDDDLPISELIKKRKNGEDILEEVNIIRLILIVFISRAIGKSHRNKA